MSSAPASPFVVEGDEYDDDVYWSKRPKFLDYVGVGAEDVAIVTSVELDHIDVYGSVEAYEAAFRAFVRAVPRRAGWWWSMRAVRARAIAHEEAKARIVFYGLEGDETGDVTPTWSGAMAANDANGERAVRSVRRRSVVRQVRAACSRRAQRSKRDRDDRRLRRGFGVDVRGTRSALATFEGVEAPPRAAR